ncbi:MAG: META domain-containing protein [Pseudomonadota bacterium]
MKKKLMATAIGIMLFGLAACGGQQDSEESSAKPTEENNSPQTSAQASPGATETVSPVLEVPDDELPGTGNEHGLLGGEKVVLWNATESTETLEYTRPTGELLTRVWILSASTDARIKLDDGVLAGVTGCNNFTGNYQFSDDGAIKFSSIGSTKMSCTQEVMEIENRLLNVIRSAVRFVVNETELVIFSEDGQRLSFTQRQ